MTKMKDKSPVIFENIYPTYLQRWTNKYFYSHILNYYQNIIYFYKQHKTSIQYLEMVFIWQECQVFEGTLNIFFFPEQCHYDLRLKLL